jgi:hypothetical protein
MLDWMAGLSAEKRLEAIDRAFEKVFAGDDGMVVLAVILDDLCFLEECRTPKEQAWNEYAKVLLKRCGRNISAQAVNAWVNVFGKEVAHGDRTGREPGKG